MNTHRDMRIRNRLILILLSPVTILLFAAGWLIQCEAAQTYVYPPPRKRIATKDDRIEMQIATVEPPEEYND